MSKNNGRTRAGARAHLDTVTRRNAVARANGATKVANATIATARAQLEPKPLPIDLPAKLDVNTGALSVGDVKLLLSGDATVAQMLEMMARAIVGGIDQYKYEQLTEMARMFAAAVTQNVKDQEKNA